MDFSAEVLNLLEKEKFCFLGTSHKDQPHVSLMNFTYLPQEKLIILSSRQDTTKVKHIKENGAVSILLKNTADKNEDLLSCTLSGKAEIIEKEKDGLFRKKHYEKNRDMENFILGKDIVILVVKINHILVSDTKDNVREWPDMA